MEQLINPCEWATLTITFILKHLFMVNKLWVIAEAT